MPNIEVCPGTKSGATTTIATATAAKAKNTAYRRQDGYTAPTVEDRAVQAALDLLAEHGYGIALRCLDCQHPITAPSSLARLRGPRCAAKAVTQ